MKKAVLIGAAGYTGPYIIKALLKAGFDISCVCRANGKMLLARWPVRVLEAQEIKSSDKADLLINLAYAKSYIPAENRLQNQELLRLMQELSLPETRIIQASSLSVFGYHLDIPQQCQSIHMRRDYLQIQSKLEMELLLQKNFPAHDLHILRIGNVWGPAAPGWTVRLLDAIRFQQPLIYQQPNYSNICSVQNLADYISFLGLQGSEKKIHHLAESGHLPWSYFLEPLYQLLGENVLHFSTVPFYPENRIAELLHLLRQPQPVQLLKALSRSRFFADEARSIIKLIPASWKKAQRSPQQKPSPLLDQLAYWILSCPRQFIQDVDKRWTAPISPEDATEAVKQWMIQVGYCR